METDLIGERVVAERGAKNNPASITGTVRAVSFQGFRQNDDGPTDLIFSVLIEMEPGRELCVALAHECTVIEEKTYRRGDPEFNA